MIDNIKYNCVEQYLQGAKAALFDDDISHAKIMRETNPYCMKKLSGKIRNFNLDRWKAVRKQAALKGVRAKYSQNRTLRDILVSTGEVTIAESSTDSYWGTGVQLHDKNSLDTRHWMLTDSGVMSEILMRVRQELK